MFEQYFKNRHLLKNIENNTFYTLTNEAILCSLIGVFICAVFLSLTTYENFYYLFILSVVQKRLLIVENEANVSLAY